MIQTPRAAAIQGSMVRRNSTDPIIEASANEIVLIDSLATSVTARAACICFCAMRPAKSLSKNVTACPMVQRWSRDRTSGSTFGCTTTEFEAADSPNAMGRNTTRKTTKPRSSAHSSRRTVAGSPILARSTTRPRNHAVTTSIVPAIAERAAASVSGPQAPDRHQRKNAPSVRGGGPSAGRKASMRSPSLTPPPPDPRFR